MTGSLRHSLPPILLLALSPVCSAAADLTINNRQLSVIVRDHDGSYEIYAKGGDPPVLRSLVAAQIDRRWIKSNEYPFHRTTQGNFQDQLGHGKQLTITFSGLVGRPRLSYVLRVYDDLPFGDVQVFISNNSHKTIAVESIRNVEAFGSPLVDLGGDQADDRVLSDAFSESHVGISDLGHVPDGMHWAVGSQLVYNGKTKRSIFFGALGSDRFLTILRLQTNIVQERPAAQSYIVDCTGTTEARARAPWFRSLPAEQRVELNLPVASGASLSSERLMFTVGTDYHAQLENYGAAVRQLHHARVNSPSLMGWWSWTAHYANITEGSAYANAQWLAQHLRASGYNLFHVDEGYQYARGEDATADASKFPHGMRSLASNVSHLGLNLGIWVAPLEVDARSWIYKQHKDWLVHDSHGRLLGVPASRAGGTIFVLDATHPDAQAYLRRTFQTMVREWNARYFKLDFMDVTAVEGFYHRPHTTALEAQRIALQTIREAVGEDVLLDKDGSPMLNPVGIVDEGRISGDTKHSFRAWKETAPGLLGRYYMHHNFFVNDPDAFTLQREIPPEQIESDNLPSVPLTWDEAAMSITLAALSGGLFEVGDDLPTLASEPERLALVTNPDLLEIVKLGRAARPVDLLDYSADDKQPSIVFLREDARQSILAVFNWTEQARSHTFRLTELGLPAEDHYQLQDILHLAPNDAGSASLDNDTLRINGQAPHSVKLIKIIDTSRSPFAPAIAIDAPGNAKVNETVNFSASCAPDGVPATEYQWNFGDGVVADGAHSTHAYTLAGTYTVNATVHGLDGVPVAKSFPITIGGQISAGPPVRYIEPTDKNKPAVIKERRSK